VPFSHRLIILVSLAVFAAGCGRSQSLPVMPPSRAELLAELDPRLRSLKAVPDEENAWILWQVTGRQLIPKKEVRDRLQVLLKKENLTAAERNEVFRMEEHMTPMAQAIAKGLKMRYCQPPFVPGAQVQFPELIAWKHVAFTKTLAMRADAEQRRDKTAIDRMELILRFGQRIREGKPTLIPYLVVIAIEKSCVKEVQRLLARGYLASSAAQIAGLIEETTGVLSAYQDAIGSDIAQPTIGILLGINEIETNESLTSKTLPLGAESMLPGLKVGDLAKVLGRHERPYDIRQTARDINAAVRPLMAQDPSVFRSIEGDLAPWEKWLASWPQTVIEGTGPQVSDAEIERARTALANSVNPFGRLIAGQLLRIYPAFVLAEFSRRTYREAASFLALWIANGRKAFPDSKDPFCDQPLCIDPQRHIYYSVGHNGVDDQGAGFPGGNDTEQPDIVFRLPKFAGK